MKKTIYILSILITFGCQPKQTETTSIADTTITNAPTMVGNDVDKHGCKGSAGYTWSAIRKECIRVFEVGIRLNVQDSTLDKTMSAFAVFATSEDTGDVEIFLPVLRDSSLILKSVKDNGAGTWSNETLTLTQWKGMYSLEEKGKLLYQGHR